jgi:hypothetical protein
LNDLEVPNRGGAAEIEEVGAYAEVSRATTLTLSDVGGLVLDLHAFAQLLAAFGSSHLLAQSLLQSLVMGDADGAAATGRTGCASLARTRLPSARMGAPTQPIPFAERVAYPRPMRGSRPLLGCSAALVLLLGCEPDARPARQGPSAGTASAWPTASAASSAGRPKRGRRLAGPPASSASAAAHADAVFALVTGGRAEELPEIATDPGKGFEPELPRKLALKRDVLSATGGRLPLEVIRRIVRQQYQRFRLCHEAANPELAGEVTVEFVIDAKGEVPRAVAGGEIADPKLRACIVSAFRGLRFPEPEGGPVHVRYPIVFARKKK